MVSEQVRANRQFPHWRSAIGASPGGHRIALLAVLVPMVAYAWLFLSDNLFLWDGSSISELHINYAGGLVRRGLLGQLAHWLAANFDFPPMLFFHLILAASYGVGLLLMARLLKPWHTIAHVPVLIFLSPGLFLFPFYDSFAFLRKDAFIALAVLVHACAATGAVAYRPFVAWCLMPLLCVATMIHEAQFFFLGFHAALTWWRGRSVALLGWLSVPALLGATLSLVPVDQAAVTLICGSWAPRPVPCDAMWALSWTLGDALTLTSRYAKDWATALQFVATAVLAAIPAMAIRRVGAWRLPGSMSLLWLATLAALPLFVVAYDWGRWVHLLAVHWVALLLAQTIPVAADAGSRNRLPSLILLAAYLGLWRLPHAGVQGSPVDGSLVALLAWHMADVVELFEGRP